MTDVTLTAALRSNLLTLQGHQKTLDATQLRLATGKKVNSALDNANAFFASSALSYRAADLSNLLDGMGQSIQTLKTADHALTAISELTQQAKATAESARDVLAGGNIFAVTMGDKPAGAVMPGGLSNIVIITTAVSASLIVSGNTLAQIASSINSVFGFGVQAFVAQVVPGTGTPATERLAIAATNGRPLTISANTAATYLLGNNAVSGGSVGTDYNKATYVAGTTLPASSIAIEIAKLESQYANILDQITLLSRDASYRGVNLLNGDTLKTPFNETNSSSLSVTGVTFSATGLGLNNLLFTDSSMAITSINQTTQALNTQRTQAKALGTNLSIIQNRIDFTSTTINGLKEGADKLTLADKNEEGANLLSTQTSQQMGITALSLASQASQAVLRLFSS